jgi:Short C-terminal domain
VTEAKGHLAPTGQRPDRDMNRNPNAPSDRGQFGRKPDAPIVVKQDVRIQGEADDIYAELKKLKELLDAKIITQDEFEVRKKKILDR